MVNRVRGEMCRMTTVCMDSYENGVMAGWIYNPALEQGRHFHSTMQFLLDMEQILSRTEFPESFTILRSFTPSSPHITGPPDIHDKTGRAATFVIRILFRQNASWQGSIRWIEGQTEESFRSVLELLFLMDSAMTRKEAEAS